MRPFLLSLAVPFLGCARTHLKGPSCRRALSTIHEVWSRRKARIELLALDLESCGQCTRTDRNLEAALRTAASLLRAKDIDVNVSRHVVTSETQARQLGFSSSPTSSGF